MTAMNENYVSMLQKLASKAGAANNKRYTKGERTAIGAGAAVTAATGINEARLMLKGKPAAKYAPLGYLAAAAGIGAVAAKRKLQGLKAFPKKVNKEKTSKVEGDGADLNFFERHPKKILGGLAAAGLAASVPSARTGLVKMKWQKGRLKVKARRASVDALKDAVKKKWQAGRAAVKTRAADPKHQAKKRANEGFAHPRKNVGHERTEVIVLRRGGKGAAESDLHRAMEGKLRGREVLDINAKAGKTDYVHHSHGKAEHIQ
jgi:hypothetical protein